LREASTSIDHSRQKGSQCSVASLYSRINKYVVIDAGASDNEGYVKVRRDFRLKNVRGKAFVKWKSERAAGANKIKQYKILKGKNRSGGFFQCTEMLDIRLRPFGK
jgi:hypothetical protein